MGKNGKYIYCVICTNQERNFGPIGIGGRGDEVLSIGYKDLSMVVSSHPMTKLVINRENMITHEKVIEEVMKEFDSVLPVRFGTIASTTDEIRGLLDRRHREFKNALRDMDYKIELGVKGIWENIKSIFEEIVEENNIIKNLKEKGNQISIQAKEEIGRLVKEALEKKKKNQTEEIVERLRRISYDYKLNKTIGDVMFMNSAFLVDRGREKEFDNIIDDLSKEYKERIKFIYAGPLPPYNFVNITIYPEEWEK